MRIFVPFDARNPKTRLETVFDADERRAFAREMLGDVIAAVRASDNEPVVLATESMAVDAPVVVDDRPLTPAVDDAIAGADLPVAVLVADLPLATPEAVERLLEPSADVVLAPGLGGGTNGLVVRTPDFHVDFHGASIRDHRSAAREAGVTPATVDSFRLALDVDEPADLAEVLLHGEATGTAAWLREAGVELAVDDGRVAAVRPGDAPAGDREETPDPADSSGGDADERS